jgi:hypothetical protein
MNKNQYEELVDKLALEIVEGVMEKEAGVGDKYFDKIHRGEGGAGIDRGAASARFGAADKAKGAWNKATDKMKGARSSAREKMYDLAQRIKDTKAYGAGRGMLGTKAGKIGAGALIAGMGVGGYAGVKHLKHKRDEGSKAAYEINDFIEKVAEYNDMDVDTTASILERAASVYQEALYGYEDSQLRKVAAGEVFEEADEDEVEYAAQLDAAVQVLEDMGIPVDELFEDGDEE